MAARFLKDVLSNHLDHATNGLVTRKAAISRVLEIRIVDCNQLRHRICHRIGTDCTGMSPATPNVSKTSLVLGTDAPAFGACRCHPVSFIVSGASPVRVPVQQFTHFHARKPVTWPVQGLNMEILSFSRFFLQFVCYVTHPRCGRCSKTASFLHRMRHRLMHRTHHRHRNGPVPATVSAPERYRSRYRKNTEIGVNSVQSIHYISVQKTGQKSYVSLDFLISTEFKIVILRLSIKLAVLAPCIFPLPESGDL